MDELTEQQLRAARAILEYVNVEPNDENVKRYIEWEIITFTHDEYGNYCWYMDDEDGTEICLRVETLQEIDTDEIF